MTIPFSPESLADRWGIEWDGPDKPVVAPMTDGYWTPWHIAAALIAKLQADGDKLAGAARRAEIYLGQQGFDHNHSVRLQIRQALTEWKDRA